MSKTNKQVRKRTFKKKDYYSGDGMLTTVWGPSNVALFTHNVI